MGDGEVTSRLQKLLESGEFVVTGECGPPKGADRSVIEKKAQYLKGNVDAVNVTDCQTAVARLSSFATSLLLKEKGIEPNLQMTCRDRNRIAMVADLYGASALGIHNLLCLTGDHQKFGNFPTAKGVYDLDSVSLIAMVKKMRDEGKTLTGEEIEGKPYFFIGAAENPFADPLEFRHIRLKKKIDAGCQFIQTQCIYDIPRFKEWMKRVVDSGLHKRCYILAGVTPLKSVGMAKYMATSVPGMTVPDSYIERLKAAPKDKREEEGIKICVEQIQELREVEGVAGIHLMAIEWEEKVPEIMAQAKLLPRPEVK
ncbi:MAG: methylenetetrahydrofolate reductase [Planctomycetota bacterium]|nr:methylenetetrahydrofolate reductase [Planctomycetota bacterium]